MNINHHPSTATLMSFAAGSLHEALSAAVACHVELCDHCKAELRQMETIGAALLGEVPPEPLKRHVHGECDGLESTVEMGYSPVNDKNQIMGSRVLSHLTEDGADLDTLNWQFLAPGIGYIPLELTPGSEGDLRLLKIRPGKKMPHHSHGGTELTLILKGAYHDGIGHYQAGDMSDYDDEVNHQPIVDDGQPCICLVASEKPAHFKGVVSRLLQPLHGM